MVRALKISHLAFLPNFFASSKKSDTSIKWIIYKYSDFAFLLQKILYGCKYRVTSTTISANAPCITFSVIIFLLRDQAGYFSNGVAFLFYNLIKINKMGKFNEKKASPEYVENYMGAKAIKQSPELELVSLLLTSMASDSYYEKEPETVGRLKGLIERCDKLFVAKAAVYARTVFGMRSITHIVASELAKHISGQSWAKGFYKAVINRPDDIVEILSYHLKGNPRKKSPKGVTKAMKVGLGDALGKFDEYQIAKYRCETRAMKLVDAVNIIHPVATEKNKEALRKLVANELKSADTWESELTKAGQKAEDESEKAEFKKEAWVKLIRSKKISYFALLRNMRNIIEQAPEMINEACELLTDKNRIKKSLVLPFRYLTAYAEIEKLSKQKFFEKDGNNKQVLDAIEKAILLSVDNMPLLTGKTIILSDNSGSMRGDSGGDSLITQMSNTKTADIANLFALLYWLKSDNTFVGLFGDNLLQVTPDRDKGLFENFKMIDHAGQRCGASTEYGIFTMFRKLIAEKIKADTIVIFSDCQIGDGCRWYGKSNVGSDFMKLFSEYKKINPSFRCYSVDLKGYGTTVFDGSVIKISGWSEKIFDVMKYAEVDKDAMINEIKKIQF